MYKRRTLLRKLSDCPLVPMAGPWVRCVRHSDLLGPPPGAPTGSRPRPLWPGGSRLTGQRFTPRGGFDTAYLAWDPQTALAEVRLALVDRDGTSLRPGPPMVVLTVTGIVLDVLDTTDPAIQRLLGTSVSELTGAWAWVPGGETAPTQVLGEAAFASGRVHAIHYHSARNLERGGRCIAVFPDRLDPAHETLSVHDPSGQLVDTLP